MAGDDGGIPDKKKAHRERHSGRKADKKNKSKPENGVKLRDRPDKERNPKAFALNSVIRAERRFRRGQDIQTKKQHIPLVDRAPIEPPPVMIAVVGPPKVGKTTLINCLIKNFTRQPLSDIKGPVTIVSGKKRRLTIMECNNDINCMIDLAKVADLVLLLVDASFGFEMEIFEFLNICQVHGMPRIMGVLTHLDMIKKSDRLKRTKKELKHRFWTEVYAGAKLFYLSGQVHGEYLRNEVKNLGRFISVMKFRPLVWRSTHPYLLADRMEDVTPPEQIRLNPKTDRSVCLYGYMRGIPLNKKSMVHVPGCGDLRISDVSFLPDPCPLPSKEKKRSLVEKDKFIYAPFSGVGGIVYDKDAVYVDLGGSHSHSVQEDNDDRQAQRELVTTLLQTQETLDEKMKHSELQLFTNAKPITGDELEQKTGAAGQKYKIVVDENGRERRKVVFSTEIDEDSTDDESGTDDEDNDDDDGEEVESGLEEQEEEEEEDEEDAESDSSGENDSECEAKPNSVRNQIQTLKEGKKKSKKKPDLENDEDSDHESDEDPSNKQKMQKAKLSQQKVDGQIKKRKALNEKKAVIDVPKKKMKISEDIENSDNEIEIGDGKKIQSLKETDIQYNKLSIDKGSEIRSKIADALSMLEKGSKEKADAVFSDGEDDWSSDDASSDAPEKGSEKPNSMSSESSASSGDDSSGDESQSSPKATGSSLISEGNNSEALAWEDSIRWKSNLQQKAADAFIDRQASTQNLWKLVYGKINEAQKKEDAESDEEVGGLFRVVSRKQHQRQEAKSICNAEDCSRFRLNLVRDWTQSEVRDLIRDCFVTGKWKESEDAEELLRLDDASDGDEELFGDFEDLETGQKFTAPQNENGSSTENADDTVKSKPLTKKEIMEKKKKLKEKFDAEYDDQDGGKSFYDELKAEVNQQAQLNKSEFEGMDDDLRVQLEGYRAGMYVRIELAQVPCELIQHFDPTYPLVIGGLLTGEENIGYVQVRMKKHRWHKRILKTRDPLIISLGWRRFQSLPIYAKLEDNMRHRMLKYTPEHVACMGHFWGPITPQSTGFLAVQDVASRSAEFRIAATGVVVEQDKSTQITKKLKLTGVPLKVYKKTAFIKDMFTSSLEVARFEGAKIKTVSGIRGQIKKACSKPEGVFRATFEDKIQLSDIVFCRTWYKVDVPQLYNPVTSLLLPSEQKDAWRGMKTTGQLKRERGIQGQTQKDSLYTPIAREPKVFRPLVIPRALQKDLPYRDRPKNKSGLKPSIDDQRVAVVREAHEQKVDKLMTMLKTNYSHKQELLKKATHERIENLKKEKEMEESRKMRRTKELRREVFKKLTEMKKVDERRAAKGGKR